MSKLESRLAEVLNSCVTELIETETYYELYKKYDIVDLCFMNEFFPEREVNISTYGIPTNELTTQFRTQ